LPFVLFIIWGGITKGVSWQELSKFPYHNITAIATISGFYLLPASFLLYKKTKMSWMITFVVISIGLGIFNPPVFTSSPDFNHITGFVHRIIFTSNSYLYPSGEIIRILSLLSFLYSFIIP